MPREYYGYEEVFAAIRNLSTEDIERIQCFARFRLGGQTRPSHVEVEDLFIDATIRTMNRKRRWQRGVSPFNYFVAAIRSIGHQGFKQAVRYEPLSDVFPAGQTGNGAAGDALIIVSRLKEQLCGDAMALQVLESMMDEMRPRRAQQFIGISAQGVLGRAKENSQASRASACRCRFQAAAWSAPKHPLADGVADRLLHMP